MENKHKKPLLKRLWHINYNLKMKLAFILLVVSFVEIQATTPTYAQKKQLTLQMKSANIEQVIEAIESESEFRFLFDRDVVDLERKIDIDVTTRKIDYILRVMFRGSDIEYSVEDRQISLSKKTQTTNSQPVNKVPEQQEYNVSGTVTDKSGVPLAGASIVVAGTIRGTQADFDGNFLITVPQGGTLEISYIGFLAQRFTITQDQTLTVQMQEDTAALDEVVVVGYGTVVKKDLTGAVASFDEKAFERQPASNDITELMKASLPGLNVGTSTGASGNSAITIRGRTSLGATNSPLIVLDDVIFQGDISSINPADVASVNVLKDASAAAVYGSRAAAGVIIITTKKGTTGKPIINYRTSVGVTRAGVIQEMYGPDDILDYRRDVFVRENPGQPNGYYHDPNNLPSGVTLNDWLEYDGLGGTSTNPTDIWLGRLEMEDIEKENYKAGNSIDWKDLIFQTGIRTNNSISVSGRTDNISYYGSLGYVNNDGILRYESYEALRGRLNLEANISDAITVGVNLQTSSQSDPQGPRNGSGEYPYSVLDNLIDPDSSWSIERQGVFGSLYYEDGSIKHNPNDDRLANNPLLFEYKDYHAKYRELFTNIYGKVQLPFGFSYRINWSNKIYANQRYLFLPVAYTLGDGGDSGSRREWTGNRWMVDNILNWKKTFGNHSFDVTFLYNVEEGETWDSQQENSIFSPNDKLSYHNLGIGANPVLNTNDTRYTGDAMMGRLNYSLLDRYYLTMTVRRDGYSAFGQANPRAVFPAASLAWRISDEAFMKSLSFINNLKLRLSWGQNGNREIGIYSALARLGSVEYLYDQATVFGVTPTDLANKNLQWENTESYNAGLDFGILGSRISGAVDVYRSITNDLLLQRTLPNITGYDDVYANLGEVQNRGVEVSLNTVNIDKADFSWSSALVFSTNKNKITHLYGDIVDVLDDEGNVIGQKEEDDVANDWYIGHAVDEIFDYQLDGIWQLGEEDEAAVYGREPGDFRIKDVNDDGVINFDDKVFQGYKDPRYRLSFRNDFSYKNFDLSILMNSLLGHKGENNEHFNFRTQQQRLNKVKTPYWTPDNPSNEWARLSSKNSSPVTNYWESKSFLRIQNITLGYNFPTNILEKFKVRNLRLYGNVQNLVPITGWQYRWDVETSAPTPVIYTFGIDLSF